MNRYEAARSFAFQQPAPDKAQWRRAILEADDEVLMVYLIEHSPYKSLTGVKTAEGKLRAKRQKVAKIREIIEIHNTMRSSFKWRPPGVARQRRYMEEQHSNQLEMKHKGSTYEISQETTCSAKNVYYRLGVFVDGKKKDVRALKKLVEELA